MYTWLLAGFVYRIVRAKALGLPFWHTLNPMLQLLQLYRRCAGCSRLLAFGLLLHMTPG